MKSNLLPTFDVNHFWQSFFAFTVFAALLFGIKLWLILTYGNSTPYMDQWDAEALGLYKPFLDGSLSLHNLFAPHNEHRIFTARLLALELLLINGGIWNPILQMVVNAILHIIALGLCILLLSRVIGRNYLPFLFAFSLALFGVPYAWENTLLGFQSQFYFVLFFSVAGIWLTVTQLPLTTQWWCGLVCSLLACLSFASGILAFAAAAIIVFLLYVMGLRKTRKQLLAVFILTGMFLLFVTLTPSIANYTSYKAVSFPHFFRALMAVLGWPISSSIISAIVRNLPALYFIGFMLWKRPAAHDRKWFLLALVLWVFEQAVSIAYGRATVKLSSRYLDLFAIGVLVNFSCLILIAKEHISKRYKYVISCTFFWILVIFIPFLMRYDHISEDLIAKKNSGLAQEANVKNYLATGDFNYLVDKPVLDLPYPNAKRLASILDEPHIQNILPANISPLLTPVRGRLDALVQGLLANYFTFIVVGLIGGALILTKYGLRNRSGSH